MKPQNFTKLGKKKLGTEACKFLFWILGDRWHYKSYKHYGLAILTISVVRYLILVVTCLLNNMYCFFEGFFLSFFTQFFLTLQ